MLDFQLDLVSQSAPAADTSVPLGRWQQGEQSVAEVGGCCLSVSFGLCADTSLHQYH